MKRIEMVHKMSDALYQFFPDMDLNKRNLIADVMLTEAEKYGMVPPPLDLDMPESNQWEQNEKVNNKISK